ncbi:hypothetical protein VSX61_19680 [Brenneria populi subsp. brevivirga]|uniref:hypothetical protein n=1 Tax=Brenneria populi TaxID=1505588 RepID=UPI002E180FE6|nr:hypothetical protein [Brenneria populi subsp. brevivirga]
MLYELVAISSDGESQYKITISKRGEKIRLSCTCMAGSVGAGVMCKHVVAVITGEFGKIIDVKNPRNAKATEAHEFINKCEIKDKYQKLLKELELLRKQFKVDEKQIKTNINGLLRTEIES